MSFGPLVLRRGQIAWRQVAPSRIAELLGAVEHVRLRRIARVVPTLIDSPGLQRRAKTSASDCRGVHTPPGSRVRIMKL
jgi:hypothetical protein